MNQNTNFEMLIKVIPNLPIQCRYISAKLQYDKFINATFKEDELLLYLDTELRKFKIQLHGIDIPASEIYEVVEK